MIYIERIAMHEGPGEREERIGEKLSMELPIRGRYRAAIVKKLDQRPAPSEPGATITAWGILGGRSESGEMWRTYSRPEESIIYLMPSDESIERLTERRGGSFEAYRQRMRIPPRRGASK